VRGRRRQSPVEPFGEDGRLRTAKPCGPGTRCWCQVGGGFRAQPGFRKTANSSTTVTRRIRRRGERAISRKAIARGMPECLRLYLYARVRFFAQFCTRDRGCSAHPAFPAPSSFWGETTCKTRTHRAAGSRSCGPFSTALSSVTADDPDRVTISMVWSVAYSAWAPINAVANIKWRFRREWPKGCHLIQIRRGHAAAYLQAAASHRSGSGLLNVPALNANLRSAIS